MARRRKALFHDRQDAGRLLADRLADEPYRDPIVLGLPRGGVPVAAEVADRLVCPLDVMMVRKLGAPGQEELAIGAVVDGAGAKIVLNDDVVAAFDVDPEFIQKSAERELALIERHRRLWLAGRPFPPLAGWTVIIVDDGIATGATARAAVLGVRRSRPAKIIVAVPVASREALATLRQVADDVIALVEPEMFNSIGNYYEDFSQVADDEVGQILHDHPARLDARGRRDPA